VPTGTGATAKTLAANAADLVLVSVSPNTETTVAGNPYSVTSRNSFSPLETSTATSTDLATELEWGYGDAVYYETTTGDYQNTFYMRVVPEQGKSVIDQGEYTIRLRLTSGNDSLLVQDSTVKVRFVSSAIGAGLTLTAADAGTFAIGEAALSTYGSTKYLKATP